MTVSLYIVTVIDELTGRQETVEVVCDSAQDAQHAACIEMFKQRGWRVTRALWPPEEKEMVEA